MLGCASGCLQCQGNGQGRQIGRDRMPEIEQDANAARDNADRAAYDGVGLGHPPARDADCGCRWRGASPYNGYLDDYSGDKDDVVVRPATWGR